MQADALAPAHRAGDLLDQAAADLLRIADRRRQHIGDQRHHRRLILASASASAIASAAGCISAQWNGAVTGSSIARLAPLALAISIARSTAALSPEITTWPAAVVVGDLADLALRRLGARPPRAASRSSPSSAAIAPVADRHGLLHGLAADPQQARRVGDA